MWMAKQKPTPTKGKKTLKASVPLMGPWSKDKGHTTDM